jgi:hypothetical protein
VLFLSNLALVTAVLLQRRVHLKQLKKVAR